MKISAQGLQIERISLPRLAWLIVIVAMFWHITYITSDRVRRDRVIDSDGAGYYVYLPALFIYHDMQFNFTRTGHPHKVNFIAAEHGLFMNLTPDGKAMNKYFIGTAILESPFFLVAYGTAPWFGFHMNGYSFPFQLAVALAAIFYVLLGLDQIRRLLVKKNIPEYVQAIVILLLFFGTNLYHYTLGEPSMSHAYSFGMIACFINQAYNVFHSQSKRAVMWTAILLAIIIAIRPVNGAIVFILPFLAGSWRGFTDGIRFAFKNIPRLAIGIGVFALLIFLQLLSYKTCTGHWFAYSYNGEKLDLFHPNIVKVLLSFRKGWFIYTPLMFVALAGIFLLRTNYERISFAAFLFVNIWVVSSWSTWTYGGSLGMRPMVDTYAAMAIPMAFLSAAIFKRWRGLIAIPALGFLVVLNLVQHYQYAMSILPYDEMTVAKYAKIFMRTNLDFMYIYDPGILHAHTMPPNCRKISAWKRTFEEDLSDPTLSPWAITAEKYFAGGHAVKLDTGQITAGLRVHFQDAFPDSLMGKMWVRIKAKVLLVDEQTTQKMAVSFRSAGAEYSWDAYPLIFKVDEVGTWQDYEYCMRIPVPPGPDGEVCIFLVHGDQSVAYADDMEMEFFAEQ